MVGTPVRERGELEQQVMRMLRNHDQPMSARELQSLFTEHIPAYTTVITVLTRLEKKGQVIRSGDSPRKVKFHAARSDEEHASETMLSALDRATDRQAVLLAFAGNLTADDLALMNASFGTPNKKR